MIVFDTYYLKVLLALLPIIVITGYLIIVKNKTLRDEQKISERFNKLNHTIAQKTISRFTQKTSLDNRFHFIQDIVAKMRIFGIDFDIEKTTIVCIVGYIAFALISYFVIGAGPLLMAYIGAIFLALVYTFLTSRINKKKRELTSEFMEKLRDIHSQMSVGLNFQTAVEESMKSSQTSAVISREFETIMNTIYTGKSMSEAFMGMYKRLQIKEVKEFASVLEVFEITGGKLSEFIKAYDESYLSKMKVQDEKDVFVAQMKSSLKYIIGVPVLCLIAFSMISPQTMKGYYGSLEGQFVGIALISCIIFGAIFSIRYIQRGED